MSDLSLGFITFVLSFTSILGGVGLIVRFFRQVA